VSVVFSGTVSDRGPVIAADDAAEAKWHSASHPPKLAFDHRRILRIAKKRLEQES
jgi:hypothetical protein